MKKIFFFFAMLASIIANAQATGACNTAYIQLKNQCGNVVSTNEGTYAKTACGSDRIRVVNEFVFNPALARCYWTAVTIITLINLNGTLTYKEASDAHAATSAIIHKLNM